MALCRRSVVRWAQLKSVRPTQPGNRPREVCSQTAEYAAYQFVVEAYHGLTLAGSPWRMRGWAVARHALGSGWPSCHLLHSASCGVPLRRILPRQRGIAAALGKTRGSPQCSASGNAFDISEDSRAPRLLLRK
jgi:hypothetical protein